MPIDHLPYSNLRTILLFKYWLLPVGIFLLFTTAVVGQTSPDAVAEESVNKEITKDFITFFTAIEQADINTVIDYMHPKMFEQVPKEFLVKSMENMYGDTSVQMAFLNNTIDSISAVKTIEETHFAVIHYTFDLQMTMDGLEPDTTADAIDPLEITASFLEMEYGAENVDYQKEAQKIMINISNRAFAANDSIGGKWTFLEYKEELSPIIKLILPEEVIAMAVAKGPSPEVCVECNSLEAALLAPDEVESLIINSGIHDITMEEIPVKIVKLENLKILYLTDHPLKSIPKEIGQLQQLEELSFAGCQLTTLPDEIFRLKNLKELILFDNDFSKTSIKGLKARFAKELPDLEVMFD